eukprot:scaffold379114_cov16-Prasinocladus_malaysianus.AAC.1
MASFRRIVANARWTMTAKPANKRLLVKLLPCLRVSADEWGCYCSLQRVASGRPAQGKARLQRLAAGRLDHNQNSEQMSTHGWICTNNCRLKS